MGLGWGVWGGVETGGDEWKFKILIFLWVESNLHCVIWVGGGGGVKIKLEEQVVGVNFLWRKKVEQDWEFMTLDDLSKIALICFI